MGVRGFDTDEVIGDVESMPDLLALEVPVRQKAASKVGGPQ